MSCATVVCMFSFNTNWHVLVTVMHATATCSGSKIAVLLLIQTCNQMREKYFHFTVQVHFHFCTGATETFRVRMAVLKARSFIILYCSILLHCVGLTMSRFCHLCATFYF